MNQSSTRPNPSPPPMTVGIPGWIRANLFNSPTDGVITIVLGAIVALAIFQSINWVFFTASWEAVTSRVPLYVIGRYPQEFYWRPETALLLISVLLGAAWRLWGGLARGFAIALIVVTLLAGALPYAGVDLGAPRYDATVSPDPPAVSPRETNRDIADAERANAIDQKNISTLTGTTYLAGTLDGDEDRSDYYSFTIDDAMKFKTVLAHQDANADVFLEDANGAVLQSSENSGTSDDTIATTIDAGTYYIRVDSQQTASNAYVLSYSIADPPDNLVNALFIINFLAVALGYFAATIPAIGQPRTLFFAAPAFFVISAILVIGSSFIPGLDPVPTQDLGGLTLNLLLATIGIVCSIPIGIMLALGRRSQLPVLKYACVGFIEIIRGVPLITLLFMSRHMLPLTFPETVSIDELYLAMITITLFSSAYMAENVRGGMAAVATGQTEAASALGLRAWQTTMLITLPQGLRNIIPAIVGQAISLFKDTSLVFIIGMLDLVEMGRVTIQGNLEFVDDGHEVYIFIAVVFWIFTFSMSYISRKIETALGVGRR
ncbi:MAG: ABC transporter permease subunit [Chloroflexi bacterium]|nr:ABC transporter permease subunit [Chloroflexota bacterium]